MRGPMASGNAEPDVVDLPVMRIYRRTGENTAVSYRLGAVLFGLLVLGGLIIQAGAVIVASPSLMIATGVVVALVGGVCLLNRHARYATKGERDAQREYERLAAREHYEATRAAEDEAYERRQVDLRRLRGKYED